MDWTIFFSAFLGSSVVAALVGALVSLRISERQISIENITKERTKWRENIRDKAVALHVATTENNPTRLEELHLEFALCLNPDDDEDIEIIQCIKQIISDNNSKKEEINSKKEEITARLSLLLKHDWERTKWEAKPVWWRRPRKPARIKYAKSKLITHPSR